MQPSGCILEIRLALKRQNKNGKAEQLIDSLRTRVMPRLGGKVSIRKFDEPMQVFVFFVLFFLLVYFWIDPKLIYHGHGESIIYPMCTAEMSIFESFPAFPGKATMYIAARLPHYYYYSWAGAAIITVIAVGLCAGADKFISAVGGGRMRWLRFVPAVFLLAQHGRYFPFLLAENLSLLVGLIFLYFYIRVPLRFAVVRLGVFTVFCVLMYAAAVQMYVVFVLTCVSIEFFNKRRFDVGLVEFVLALLAPFLANILFFDLTAFEAYRVILTFPSQLYSEESVLAVSFFCFFPVVGFGLGLWRIFMEKRKPVGRKVRRKRKSSENHKKGRVIRTAGRAAIFITAVGFVWFTCDHTARQKQRIDYYARNKMWDELLLHARQLQSSDMFICHDVNRALYHSGRLLDDMFLYPQDFAGLLLTPGRRLSDELMLQIWTKSSNTLFELGHINQAENFSYEALTNLIYYPEGLRRLALINIIKGQTGAARNFLHALSKDFLYEDEAKEYIRRLSKDPLLSEDEDIQRMRSFVLVEDRIESDNKTTPKDLLEKNGNNRMAFEYLMAFCLLTGQHAGVAHSVGYLDNFEYPRGQIPRHLEEAILLYLAMGGEKPELHGRRINPETSRKFGEFMQLFQRYKGNRQAAAGVLEKQYGDTYYYFYFFLLDESGL